MKENQKPVKNYHKILIFRNEIVHFEIVFDINTFLKDSSFVKLVFYFLFTRKKHFYKLCTQLF